MTLPVRSGANFSGNPLMATVAGVTYTVPADGGLSGNDLTAVVRTPLAPGLPELGAGYEYRSFRLTTSADQTPRGFLRRRVSEAP